MHREAREGFRRMLVEAARIDDKSFAAGSQMLDLGGADINGTVHDLFTSRPRVLDMEIGPDVDIVADARQYESFMKFDVIMTTELLEHVNGWELVVACAFENLKRGGWFLGTAASDGRFPHGARGGARPEPGEHYGNVNSRALFETLRMTGFVNISTVYNPRPGDVYWRAQRPRS